MNPLSATTQPEQQPPADTTHSGVRGTRPLSEREKARRIRRWIRAGGRRLVKRHPILKHQDAIGMTLCIGSALAMLGLGFLYARGVLSGWLVVLGCGFFASILHELEHDLIHYLYFRSAPAAHHFMMFVVWVFRGNVVHGWFRRYQHLLHHQTSGTAADIETRIIGLGQRWGVRRLLMLDGAMCLLLNGGTLEREIAGFSKRAVSLAALPVSPLFSLTFGAYLATKIVPHIAPQLAESAAFSGLVPVVDVLGIAWVVPNVLRTASLHVISSNVHYYGDVEHLNQELQVLRPFFLWPLQFFCFNFGTTHVFHHYVIDQPFYVRQLISSWVLPGLRKYGVRFNDVGTFLRANRYQRTSAAGLTTSGSAVF